MVLKTQHKKQKEQKDQASSDEQPAMPVFETPLIEVGSLLLDAMPGAHSAEQPFFHKAAMVVIEHNIDVLRCADWIIDMGPGGGVAGGEVVAWGTPDQVAENPDSLTGRYL